MLEMIAKTQMIEIIKHDWKEIINMIEIKKSFTRTDKNNDCKEMLEIAEMINYNNN